MANPKPALAREVDLDQRQVVGAFAAPVLSIAEAALSQRAMALLMDLQHLRQHSHK